MRTFTVLLFAAAITSAQTATINQPLREYSIPRDPSRDPWQKPDEVISALNFSTSETVVTIENGYPYFAPRIAPFVKKVYAANTNPQAFQGRGTLPLGISRIISTNSDPGIAGLNVDTVIMVDMLRWLPQRPLYYLGITTGLRPGGRLIIIDRKVPLVFPAAQQITDTVLKAELPLVGFALSQQYTLLPYQYFLVFQR